MDKPGAEVTAVGAVADARRAAESMTFDAALPDVNPPDGRGTDLLRDKFSRRRERDRDDRRGRRGGRSRGGAHFAGLLRDEVGIISLCMNPVAEPLLETHRARIADLCRRHHVARLEVFGSATRENFSRTKSDFDFLVRFASNPPKGIADAYLGLAEGLEKILGRPVDLVTEDSVRNPYFRASLNSSRELVYDDHRSQEVVV